ncbi:MAG: hypothetical protein NTU53_09720 [Planctomycetota bacterium]|nr:hypothetical protein [Planctomycetota bacterium]
MRFSAPRSSIAPSSTKPVTIGIQFPHFIPAHYTHRSRARKDAKAVQDFDSLARQTADLKLKAKPDRDYIHKVQQEIDDLKRKHPEAAAASNP